MIVISSNKRNSKYTNQVKSSFFNSSEYIVHSAQTPRNFSIILNNKVILTPSITLTVNDIRGNLNPNLINAPGKLIGNISGSNINWYSGDIITTLNYHGSVLQPFGLFESGAILSPSFYQGMLLNIALKSSPIAYLSGNAYAGENFYNTLQISKLLATSNYYGSVFATSLDTHLSFSIGTTSLYNGSNTNISIVTFKLLNFSLYNGTVFSSTLNTYLGIEFGSVTMFNGSTINVGLITFKLISFNPYSGDTCYAELKTNLQFQLQLNILQGDTVSCELQTSPVLSLTKIYQGDKFYSVVKDAPSVQLNLTNIFNGSNINVSIIISQILNLQFYDGSIEYSVLKDSPSIPLSLTNIFNGSSFTTPVVISRLFNFNCYTGSNTFITDLVYVINPGTNLDFCMGDGVEVDKLITYPSLSTKMSADNFVEFEMSTSYILYSNVINHGESVVIDLHTAPPPIFDFTVNEGARVDYKMYFRIRLGIFQFDGSTFYFDFKTHESPPLEFNAYSGQSCTIWLPEIKLQSGYSGEYVNIASMGTESLWKFKSGEVCNVSGLRTSAIFTSDVHIESYCKIDLSVKHSEGLGTFNAFGGEFTAIPLQTAITQFLSVLFEHDLWTKLDIDSTVYFDLTTDACCGTRPLNGQHSYIIELDNAEYPEEVFYGNSVKFTVVLSTNNTLDVQFYPDDYRLFFIDSSDHLSVDFYSGEIQRVDSFQAFINNRLCNGYFIPSGDSVITEFTDVITEDCYSDMGYMGESMSCKLAGMPNMTMVSCIHGDTFTFNLTLDAPWELEAYGGENLTIPEFVRISTFEPVFNCRAGSVVTISFPEPDWLGYSGEYVHCTLVATKITIEFAEAGCLQNEFQFRDKLGNIIPEKYMPVAIELYPFEHQLKLKPRCVF